MLPVLLWLPLEYFYPLCLSQWAEWMTSEGGNYIALTRDVHHFKIVLHGSLTYVLKLLREI